LNLGARAPCPNVDPPLSVCHPTQVNAPRLNPSEIGRYSIYLPQRDGRLSTPRRQLDSGPTGNRTHDHKS